VEMLTNAQTYGSMQRAINPYGDGHASEQIVALILDWFTPAI
jgi:UDP-N-acetylglucosamine 2-epimerase